MEQQQVSEREQRIRDIIDSVMNVCFCLQDSIVRKEHICCALIAPLREEAAREILKLFPEPVAVKR